MALLDVAQIKGDFPIFARKMRNDNRLVYLDSGATSQKPSSVIASQVDYYANHNAAVHRGAHLLAEEADELYEGAREFTARFIGAATEEIIFTKSATESLNLLAYALSSDSASVNSQRLVNFDSDSEILVTEMEHHANLIPWQEVARRTGAKLKWVKVQADGRLDLKDFQQAINSKTKIVAFTHQSNVLGVINPVNEIAALAKKVNALTILDACQSVPHLPVNVQELGVDFLAFSAHKALGPTGVGVLWGKAELLDALPPFLFGGSMIDNVTMESAQYSKPPRRFEAGVPNMAGVIGMGAGLKYLADIGMEKIHQHEVALTDYALEKLLAINGLTLYGPKVSQDRGAIFSFALAGIHPHDCGQVLDQHGIAVRTGHHCAWPLMKKFGLAGTVRATGYLYNDYSDIDALVDGLQSAQKYFGQGA
jgi:cysteine desulfurase / selenocysteine lyase